MDWLADNIPLISGIAVAALSFLSSFIKLINEQNAGTKITKRLREYADVYTALPDSIDIRDGLEKLLKIETERLLQRVNRKLNIANMIAVIVVAIVGGGLSYLFVLWAINSTFILWTMLAWILFAFAAFFTLGLSIAGLASIYEEPKEKQAEEND